MRHLPDGDKLPESNGHYLLLETCIPFYVDAVLKFLSLRIPKVSWLLNLANSEYFGDAVVCED